MEFRDYIQSGIDKSKNMTELAKNLGVTYQALYEAKKHERGLPEHAIFKLAEILKVEPQVIIAARELALAKTEEKRKFWEGYINKVRVMGATICVATITNFMIPAPANAGIDVTNSVTHPSSHPVNSTTCVETTQAIQIIRNNT